MADPGFPRGGGANPKGGGCQPIIWPTFPENCMKMKKFWAGGGMHPSHPPLDLPLFSVNFDACAIELHCKLTLDPSCKQYEV